jgi:glucosamine--fructose-6-phosphate aminotransferase (isomerizing)
LLTLAIAQMAARTLSGYSKLGGGKLRRHFDDLERTVDGIEVYFQDWEVRMGEIGAALTGVDERAPIPPLVLIGRGPSYTTALAGALNLQEAAKIPALGAHAAEFRHGPMEMAAPGLSALIFTGAPGPEQELSRKLWSDLRARGVAAWLLAGARDDSALPSPAWAGIGLPLAEIIPVQLLCVYIALKTGLTPGLFRNIGKVTVEE